jgi:hypothetical protein
MTTTTDWDTTVVGNARRGGFPARRESGKIDKDQAARECQCVKQGNANKMKQQYSSGRNTKVECERATRRESGGREVLIEQRGQGETGKQVRCGKRVEREFDSWKEKPPVDAGPWPGDRGPERKASRRCRSLAGRQGASRRE